MSTEQATTPMHPIVVRGRCACGRRFRIRNAYPGAAVACPACNRPIVITEADLRAAFADECLVPLQQDDVEPQEAIPLDWGELSLAPDGSRPGLTGDEVFPGDEALMYNAMRGWTLIDDSHRFDTPSKARGEGRPPPVAVAARGFIADLFASFIFAGSKRNAANLGLTAATCSLLTAALFITLPLPMIGFFWGILALLLLITAIAHVTHTYGSILLQTARGEDDLPWVPGQWDMLHDGILPIARMALVTGLCAAPAAAVEWWLPGSVPRKELIVWTLAVLGALPWPMAILSVMLTDSVAFLRPDYVMVGMARLGGAYLLACIVVAGTLVGWAAAFGVLSDLPAYSAVLVFFVPLLTISVSLYFGYVMFRTLGLLVRHYGQRVPWLV